MNLKDRLNDLHLGITELAKYLNISRPTLYKFISLYDEDQKKEIPKNIIQLFDYIMKNELIGKNNIVNYIFHEILSLRQNKNDELINQLVFFDKNSWKYKFIEELVATDEFDLVCSFLYEVHTLQSKNHKTKLDKDKLDLYKQIIKLLEEIK